MEHVGLTLEVVYESAMGLLQDHMQQLRLGGLFAQVPGGDALEPFAPLALSLVVDGHAPIRAPARLTSATAESMCVEVLPEARAGLDAAVAALAQAATEAGPLDGPAGRREVRLRRSDAAPEPRREHAPMPLDRRIAAMSVSEKVQAALHGGRDERTLLMKERAGVVQASIVRNPRATLDEITALARAPHLQADAAEAIAAHPSYGSSAQVALALVRNPRAPVQLAVQLVEKLQPADLRAVAKGLGVRVQIAQAARKRLFEGG